MVAVWNVVGCPTMVLLAVWCHSDSNDITASLLNDLNSLSRAGCVGI